ncbi:MAG: DNA-directed RNA polymerase subunit alpha, partial [bacterium]
ITLDKDNFLELEMEVDLGKGYSSAEKNKKEGQPIGVIPIDAVFSPIKKVNYSIENIYLVDEDQSYDKLIFEVWTNGSISPEDAVACASKTLKDYYSVFINFEEKEDNKIEDKISNEEQEIKKLNDNLSRSVEELELSVRSSNCLKNANIRTIGELVQKSEGEMLRTKNFGRKSLNEIKEILTVMGLHLGMKMDNMSSEKKNGD